MNVELHIRPLKIFKMRRYAITLTFYISTERDYNQRLSELTINALKRAQDI